MPKSNLQDTCVLITGGTGSFGSTMARDLLDSGVGEIRILSRDEAKQDAMRNAFQDERVRFYIGDVRDPIGVKAATRGADLLFHAAALKQVPSAEFFPLEAVSTNVLGSANVIRAAIESQVKSVVCLSTDKAVYPINAMGMTKGLMEKTAQSFARNGQSGVTKIAITRYGNVMASRGSVIPLFLSQIRTGKPITITNPEMTRFLMNLSESVDLVKYAFQSGENGDLFVKKAPAATVGDLATAILSILGLEDYPVKIIGTRHGEKLFESLLSVEERAYAIDSGDYYRVPLDTRGLDYSAYFNAGSDASADIDSYTSHNAERLTIDQIKAVLLALPEFKTD